MRYDIDYRGITESLLERIRCSDFKTGEQLQNSWLSEFDQSVLEEAERLNVILGVI